MNPNGNLDIKSTTAVNCEKCGNHTFSPVVFLRKVSRFVSPDGQDHVIPMDSMACSKCGHINDDFNPIIGLDLVEVVESETGNEKEED